MLMWNIWTADNTSWDLALQNFSDYNVYQSSSWGEYKRSFGWIPVKIVASKNNRTIAMAQVLVRKFKFGIALTWVPGGPIGDLSSLNNQFWSCLKAEVASRFMYCKINLFREDNSSDTVMLKKIGWNKSLYQILSGMSLLYKPSLEESVRRSEASKNWRHNLKRSNKYNNSTELWLNPNVEQIIEVYNSMQSYKNISVQITKAELEMMQANFKNNLIVVKCVSEDGELLAIRGALIFGTKGWDILAAASPKARKVYASHSAFWALMNECSLRGIDLYDMSGADPVGNKGVYNFKKGTGAKDISHLAEWDKASSPVLRLVANLFIKYRMKGA